MTAETTGQTPARSLREQAYDVLRDRIIGLAYTPGQRLFERDLAAELEISRIPLREALQLLQNDGLVVIVPRQGAIVSPFTADDVRHLFDVRETFEALATRLAAERATPEDLATLQHHIDDATAAVAEHDQARIAAANSGFHHTLVDIAGNPLLKAMMGPLQARVQWLFHLTRERDPIVQGQEHQDILDAIAAHDIPAAERHASQHIASGRHFSIEMAQHWSITSIDPVAATRSRRR